MTAGVVHVPRLPRCGCCDGLDVLARCERCQEPTCARHLERFEGAYVCTICREAVESERAVASAVEVAS